MYTKGPWKVMDLGDGYRIVSGKKIIAGIYFRDDVTPHNARLIAAAPDMEDEIDSLANVVALNSHGEGCYAEYWWDSSCDCGLMDLVMQLSPRLQNKLEAIRKAKSQHGTLKGDDTSDLIKGLERACDLFDDIQERKAKGE